MATIQELETALINADKAGDEEAAKVLAAEIVRVRGIGGQQASTPLPAGTQEPNLFPPKPPAWKNVPGMALSNTPESAGRFVGGIAQAVAHPLNTGMALWDAAAGGLRNVTPDFLVNAIEGGKPNPSALRATQTANAVGQMYKDRYGGAENIKQTLATDPVGAAADLSTVLTGGAMLAPKASMSAGLLNKAASITNPVNVVKPIAKGIGTAGKYTLGLTTGVGPETIAMAGKSGLHGNKAFMQNLTDEMPKMALLDKAKTGLANMRSKRLSDYKASIGATTQDKTLLNFGDIDAALNKAKGSLKVKSLTPSGTVISYVDEAGNTVDVPRMPAKPQTRNLLAEINRAGGLSADDLANYGLTSADANRIYPGLFRKQGGMAPDDLAEWLGQNGWVFPQYLDEADANMTGGAHELARDLVKSGLNKERITHPTDFDSVYAYDDAVKQYQDATKGLKRVENPLPEKEYWKVGKTDLRTISEAENEIARWRKDPGLHTAEGLDALKQRLDSVYPESQKAVQAQRVVSELRNAVKDTIVKQSPKYAETMQAYETAINLEREISKALSLNDKVAADTALRKLQSLARNNANTNYGYRLDLAKELENAGGVDLMPSIAGQAMNSWYGRGLLPQAANLSTIGWALSHPSAAFLLPLQSPKAVGAALYGGGLLGKKISDAGLTPEMAARIGLLSGQTGLISEY